MNPLIVDLPKHSKYLKLLDDIKQDSLDLSVIGLTDSQKAHMIYSLAVYSKKSALIVCNNVIQARKFIQDLKFYSEINIIYFPSRDIVYYDIEAQSREIQNQRIYTIQKIINKDSQIIVTTIDALLQKMMPLDTYFDLSFLINKDSKIEISDLAQRLVRLGYTRTNNVDGKGQFAIRGGIVDIFPIDVEFPYRIELFGDEVDSIRTFDVQSQRSLENVEQIDISYSSEFLLNSNNISNTLSKLKDLVENGKINENLKNQINDDIEKIENGDSEPLIDKYFDLFIPKYETFIDYLKDYVVYIDEPSRIKQKVKNVEYENQETLKMLADKNYIYIPYANKYLSYEEIEIKYKYMINVYLEKINTDRIMHAKRKEYNFSCREVNFFRGSMDILIQDLKRWQNEKKLILLVYPSESKTQLVYNQLIDNGIKNVRHLENIYMIKELKPSEIYVTYGILSSGYEYDDFNLCVVAEPVSGIDVINNSTKKLKIPKSIGQKINTFDDLNEGDYVVHETHGIGIYRGVHTVSVEKIKKDYIKIEYANDGVLYVPINQLDNVKKYTCDDDTVPKLNILGSKQWHKTKSKAQSYIETVAKDLVLLYAKRKLAKGFAFSKDTPWQKEFEDTFKYELTDDQKQALQDVKYDMEQETPMDRLLCGDVGYGKTEVAIRAAFKAVMDSKQVAYLVPTTVLALQQYRTFKERMEPFGIKIEMLSRFKTPTEQKEILKRLENGQIDVVIGTHRLLSKDVKFKNLAFLIIDEEHRFGVKAKETIKKMKENIDVLSMTATPIPRTLHMSMIGIRSMSTLSMPPLERMPIHTYVLEYDDQVIKEAIEKELSRDGQVFYINNRVENIEAICRKVKNLVPEAKVEFAHGQMEPRQIEDIMLRFINHQVDVIVCTTILESGIDIQNANTLIIENADRLGLAQLYQIRGRVGRSSRLAYAYITYPKNKQVSEIAEKRLKAIKDFTEFGSGFKIALRDLEIRGAGNLFGKQQHGHMASIGYEMYLAMLEKAIKEEKSKFENIDNDLPDSILNEVKIELNVSAYISDKYISDIAQKIQIYQKISNIQSDDDAQELISELIDRFGNMPIETENLIKVVQIRNLARSIGITKIVQKQEYIILEPGNLKYQLTNSVNNDILVFINVALHELQKMLKIEKGK